MKVTEQSAPAGAPEVPAAVEPDVVPQSTDQTPEPAPEPTPAPPGDSPEPADKRVKDAQHKMHAATSDAAELRKENTELRATLSGIFNDPRYQPLTAPTAEAGQLSEADLKAAWTKYQAVPQETPEHEFNAFKVLLSNATDLALRRLEGRTSQETVAQQNRARAVQQATELKTAITAQVQALASDIAEDMDLFWDWAAPKAQQEALRLRFPDVTAMVDWQVNRCIQMVRQKLGKRAPAPVSGPTPSSIQRPATAAMPSGSLTPRGGTEPTAPRRNMVEQVNSLREKHAQGAG